MSDYRQAFFHVNKTAWNSQTMFKSDFLTDQRQFRESKLIGSYFKSAMKVSQKSFAWHNSFFHFFSWAWQGVNLFVIVVIIIHFLSALQQAMIGFRLIKSFGILHGI